MCSSNFILFVTSQLLIKNWIFVQSVILDCTYLIISSLISNPIKLRFKFSHSNRVVPLPINGSNIISSLFVWILIISFINFSLFWVGCIVFSLPATVGVSNKDLKYGILDGLLNTHFAFLWTAQIANSVSWTYLLSIFLGIGFLFFHINTSLTIKSLFSNSST